MRHLSTVLAPLLALALGCHGFAADAPDPAKAKAELLQLAPEIAKLSRVFNLVHEVVAPSVVAIHTRANRPQIVGRGPFGGLRIAEREVEVGEGSGFVVRSDAQQSWVLTNAHVVLQTNEEQRFVRDNRGAAVAFDRLRVELNDGREIDAELVGHSLDTDLAIVRIPLALPAVEWADSDKVHVGDWVVALGYPLGVGYSASSGIVSATERSTGVYRSLGGIESFIQTDAAINPGNSGGPLVNTAGQIIGVNSNIKSTTGVSIGLGFAITANLARRVAEDLINHGEVRWPAIGITMPPDELSAEDLEKLGVPFAGGAPITGVYAGTPAATAGLKPGDFLTSINGVRVRNQMQFSARLRTCRIGDAVTLTLWRNGSESQITVTPVSRDELDQIARANGAAEGIGTVLPGFGMRLADDRRPGLVVTQIDRDGLAARAGLSAGDRILAERGAGALEAEADLAALGERREVVLQILKDGRTFWLRLKR
jgi:S1-C subfamily serine protease